MRRDGRNVSANELINYTHYLSTYRKGRARALHHIVIYLVNVTSHFHFWSLRARQNHIFAAEKM